MAEGEMERHSVLIPPDLWDRAERATMLYGLLEGGRTSVSELIRRGLREQIKDIEERAEGRGYISRDDQ